MSNKIEFDIRHVEFDMRHVVFDVRHVEFIFDMSKRIEKNRTTTSTCRKESKKITACRMYTPTCRVSCYRRRRPCPSCTASACGSRPQRHGSTDAAPSCSNSVPPVATVTTIFVYFQSSLLCHRLNNPHFRPRPIRNGRRPRWWPCCSHHMPGHRPEASTKASTLSTTAILGGFIVPLSRL